jgi:hypothetical protein
MDGPFVRKNPVVQIYFHTVEDLFVQRSLRRAESLSGDNIRSLRD